jgi:hypothetical protein
MEPNIWGKHAWIFLHSVSMNYPDNPSNEDRKNHKNFFENLRYVLPCEVCKKHFTQHILHNPIEPALHSKRKLVEWLINVHNQVNISLNKPTMTYDQVIELYKKIYNGNMYLEDVKKTNKEEKKFNSNMYIKKNNSALDNISNNYLENNIVILIIITLLLFLFILWKKI